MYAVGTDANASSKSPAIAHRCCTLESSVPAKTILTVCMVMMILAAADQPGAREPKSRLTLKANAIIHEIASHGIGALELGRQLLI